MLYNLKIFILPFRIIFLLRMIMQANHGIVVLVASHVQPSCDPMDCRPPGSSLRGFSKARILEWVAISF